MKKYKLAKLYPNLNGFDIGDEVSLVEMPPFRGYKHETKDIFVGKNQVENFPEFWEPVKDEVVLTTYDGVGLKVGDTYWWCNTCYYKLYKNKEKITEKDYNEIIIKKRVDYLKDHILLFSTEKACDDYIEYNTKKYSLKDISHTLACCLYLKSQIDIDLFFERLKKKDDKVS